MERPIRIAYFDLGFSKEQYGLQPTRYGGGGVAARYLKEDPEIDFHIFAPAESFDNVGRNERGDRCHPMPDNLVLAPMRAGSPVPFSFEANFNCTPDIIMHGHTCFAINKGPVGNRKGIPIVHWSGFDGKAGHSWNDYILLYDDSFVPLFGEKPKYVRIGKPVPEVFRPHPKAPYVFQCSRHDDHMNSLELARQCRRYGIQGYFAGPIHHDYPIMSEIDGKVTHYLGEIDEATKLGYQRHARLQGLLLNWESPYNQTIIEAQGLGTPIYVNRRGPFLNKYLQHGVNGFDASLISLPEAFDKALTLSQEDCWKAARPYDVSVMIRTFKQAFKEIVEEWANR